jgi:uncharacterized protein YdhG (YjbR/CyaY superfamily)
MQSKATTVTQYLAELEPERREPMSRLRETIARKLPKGFEEQMSYGMIGWVVPHKLYPAGYHCDPKLPLPFLSLASQKQAISVYHMGLYADANLLDWFAQAHAKASPKKLDMGKSCIRYKKAEDIPFELLGELAGKMTVKRWIELYESTVKDSRRKTASA